MPTMPRWEEDALDLPLEDRLRVLPGVLWTEIHHTTDCKLKNVRSIEPSKLMKITDPQPKNSGWTIWECPECKSFATSPNPFRG